MRIDLRDFDAVTKIVETFRPDVIVHTAAERRIDVCEKEKEASEHMNVGLTKLFAQLTKKYGGWLLFISTDYVFDGKSPPYSEGDDTNPLNEYAKQKRDAEIAAREADWGCGVLRVPLLYGAVKDLDESGVSHVLQQILDKKPAKQDDLQIRYPTLVDDIAVVCKELAEQKMDHCGLSGVWHWSGDEKYTKYEIAKIMGEVFNLDTSHIQPTKVDNSDVRAPNARLDTTTLKLMGIGKSTPFKEGLKKSYSEWIK